MQTWGSDHDDLIFSKKEEWKLINHGLDCVFQVRPHHFEAHHVSELKRKKSWPPADGQVLRIHVVGFAVLRNPAMR